MIHAMTYIEVAYYEVHSEFCTTLHLLISYIERIHQHWFSMLIIAILLILFSASTFGARLIENGVVSGVVQLVGPWTQLQLLCAHLLHYTFDRMHECDLLSEL